MREVCKLLQVDTKMFRERALLSEISKAKDELVTPQEYRMRAEGDYSRKKIAEVYEEYEKQLRSNNALDFDDLLFKTVQLFQTQKDVLEYYQERFRYIMVDEYQDTNTVQFELIHLLASKYRNLWWLATMTSPFINSAVRTLRTSWILNMYLMIPK